MSIGRAIILGLNLVGMRFGGAAISFLSQVLLARLLLQSEVGVVFMGMSAAAFISLLVTGGYPHLAITSLPRYHALGRSNLVMAFHIAFLKDGLIIAIATFAIAAIVYFFLPLSDAVKTALLFGCLSAPSSAFLRMNSAIANSVRRYGLSYLPDYLIRPGIFFLFLLVCWSWHLPVNTVDVLWAFVIANTMTAIWQGWKLEKTNVLNALRWLELRNLAPYIRARAGALVLVGLVSTAFSDIVTVISGFFLFPADVALVGVCVKLAALAGFVTQASQQFILPDLTLAMTKGDISKVHAILWRINIIALAAILAFFFGSIIFGGYALKIYGAAYERGHWVLVLFLIGQILRAGGGMNQHLLAINGFQIKTAGSCLVAMITLCVSIAVLATLWGAMGVAIATIIADALWAMLLAIQARKLLGKRGDILGIKRLWLQNVN